IRLQQTGNGKTLSIPQLDRRSSSADNEGWDRCARDCDSVGEIQLAHFGIDGQIDDSIIEDGRPEAQQHTEVLELDGWRGDTDPARDRYRDRKLAAGLKARSVAGKRNQVRLRQPLQQAFVLKRGY